MLRKGLLGMAAGAALLLQVQAASAQGQLNNYNHLIQRVEQAEKVPAPADMAAPSCCIPDGCCDSCGPRGRLYGMYENVLLTPHWTRNDAFTADVDDQEAFYQEFEWDLKYSPRFELGYLAPCGGLGARIRYWHFDHDQSQTFGPLSDANVAISGSDPDIEFSADNDTTFDVSNSLSLRVLDLEALKQFADGNLVASAGLRYVRMDQDYQVAGIEDGDVEVITSDHDFEGVGPTVAGEIRHRLGRGMLTLFALGRGSVLFGDSNWTAIDVNNAPDDMLLRSSENDTLAIGELQIGVEASRETAGGALVFLRLALEGQYWVSAGSPLSTNMTEGDIDAEVVADPQEPDMGLFGFTIGLGIAR